MRVLSRDEKAIIFLDGMEYIEYKHKKAIIELFSRPSQIFDDNRLIDGYLQSVNKGEVAKTLLKAIANEDFVEEVIASNLRGATDVITLVSNSYPTLLKQTPTPPLVLYARGNVELLSKDKFAIVGSRKTLLQYAKRAEDISSELSSNGVVIVTGIASGADTSAIKGGLKSGNVISVFAGEVGKAYPATANDLSNKIIENGGLIISEYPCGSVPKVYSYPVRNRIIAGLSLGVLIVSGNLTSGTRYTADYALDYGREVFCLPYGIGTSGGEICNKLIKSGAVMVETATEIADYLSFELKVESEPAIVLTEKEKTLYKLIKQGFSSTDSLAENSNMLIFEIISTLGMLELKGLIVKDPIGNYSARK
ncbi:MAG: DNA-protecting protein DprA [Clostridia bacterium]|nr:DNA-protecting protein DprA [Clostridia bacterium]